MVAIKEGFSWGAGFLHFFWALYKKMWLVAFILFSITTFLTLLELKSYVTSDISQALKFGLLLFTGFNFNDWHSAHLVKNGYIFQGVISGKDEEEAHYKYLTEMLQRSTFVPSQA